MQSPCSSIQEIHRFTCAKSKNRKKKEKKRKKGTLFLTRNVTHRCRKNLRMKSCSLRGETYPTQLLKIAELVCDLPSTVEIITACMFKSYCQKCCHRPKCNVYTPKSSGLYLHFQITGDFSKISGCTMPNLHLSYIASKGSISWCYLGEECLGLIQSFSLKHRYSLKKQRNYTRVASMEPSVQVGYSQLRCAIVTGVSRPSGIGRCLVYNFIQQGYKVVGLDIKDFENDTMENQGEQQILIPSELLSDNFHFVHADISDPVKVKLAIKKAVQWFGDCIHVLINNAGRTNVILDGEDPMKVFADTISVNLNGAYYVSESVLPYMPPGLSSIINISSARALQSEPGTAAYSASKAGLCGLTHSLAITLAGRVRVNAVLPGWINTDPAGELALRTKDHSWHPAGRVGTPQDVAEICLFLCDEKRSGFITGQEFVVDGGVTKKMVYPE